MPNQNHSDPKELKGKGKEYAKFEKDKIECNPTGKPWKHGAKDSKSKSKDVKVPRRNDPAFYTKYSELAESVARLAFNHRNGSNIIFDVGSVSHNMNIDPIVVVDIMPTPGLSSDMTSGINVAANAAYKVLNRKYRGSASSRYQPADLGIAQFAIVDFLCSLAQAERTYGLAMEVRVNQRQIPRELLFALGYDADDFVKNYAEYRYQLNYLVTRAKALCLIKGYTLLDHWLFLCANVFKDKDTARAQYFGYNKPGFWKWNPTYFTTGSALEWVDNKCSKYMTTGSAYKGLRTVNDVLDDLEAQLEPLLMDSDIDAICTDILAFFGSEDNNPNIVTLGIMPEDYRVEAVYDENVLKQFHNTTVFELAPLTNTRVNYKYGDRCFSALDAAIIDSSQPTPSTIYISQQNGVIKFNFTTTYNATRTILTTDDGKTVIAGTSASMSASALDKHIIDTIELNPSPADIMEYTRNTVLFTSDYWTIGGTPYYMLAANAFGSVIPLSMMIYDFSPVGENNRDSNGDLVFGSPHFHSFRTVDPTNAALFCLSRFDWAPTSYKDATSPAGVSVVSDLDNYIAIDRATLAPIHDVAMLSEFHNPISDIIIQNK